jgi:tetratricopeptide (TPR) repeat protein
MNKKFTYIAMVCLFLGGVAFVVLRYNKGLQNKINAFYPLQERKGILASSAEWASTKEKAGDLIRIVRDNPGDNKSALALASVYLQESRVTGNNMYYDAAALHYLNQVLEQNPADFEALTLKALVYLSQHHFAEAITIAEQAQKVGPYNAFVYGLLVDGHVEMGNYKAAIENAEKMMSLRPDIRSYSRVAYLREIHGDNTGAIEAMNTAVKAGGGGDEPTSWARVQLGKLYENTGDLKHAEMHYTIALDQRPGYAYAIAGLGNIAEANKDYNKAIQLYEQADSLLLDYTFKEKLASLYERIGEEKKAKALMKAVIKGLSEHAEMGEKEDDIGHYADRELAYAYILEKDYDKALKHALAEYRRRPANIDVNETVAWAYYNRNEYTKALQFIELALKTNCKNPTLLTRAGLIFSKNGQLDRAKTLLQEALMKNPAIDFDLKQEGFTVLQTFNQQTYPL